MRAFICQFLILSLFFVSLEGATDVVTDGVTHGDDASHQEEFGHQLDDHQGDTSDTELDGKHCEHCCHGHATSMTVQVVAITMLTIDTSHWIGDSAHIPNLVQAPPTPPPNA